MNQEFEERAPQKTTASSFEYRESVENVRVPYRERRAIKKHLVPRVKKSYKKRRRLKSFAVSVLILSTLLLGFFTLNNRASIEKRDYKLAQVPKKTGADETTSSIFMVFGIDEKGLISNAALIAYEKKEKAATILTLGGETYLDILGIGLQKLSSIEKTFAALTYYSIDNSFPFKISFFLTLQEEHLTKAIDSRDISTIISLATEVKESRNKELPKKTRLAYESDFKNLNKADMKVIACPTKFGKAGKEELLLIDESSLEQISKVLLSNTFKEKSKARSVLVLNGSGIPGAASKAAMLLIEAGYKIFNVRNADSFNYENTKIEVYGIDESEALKVKAVLGFGEITVKKAANDLIDISVIVGSDFARSP